MKKPFWTTSQGKRISYKRLEDDHLKNIIKDGYRNENLIAEVRARGFEKELGIMRIKNDPKNYIYTSPHGTSFIFWEDLENILYYEDKRKFTRWMRGSTCIAVHGHSGVYPWDLARFLTGLNQND